MKDGRYRESLEKRIKEWKPNDELPDSNKNFDEEYLDLDDLVSLPESKPIIKGILIEHTLTVLRGRDHSFKSFVALDWALSVAGDISWQGRTVEAGKVLYVAGEGEYGINKRVEAWRQKHPEVKFYPGAFTLRKSAFPMFKDSAALADLLERVERERYKLVVFDTLRRISGSANQNSSDMGQIIDNLDRIKIASGDGTVLTLAHTDKGDNDTRGFSGIEDDMDVVWHARRKGLAHNFQLENAKMKDGPDGELLDLRVQPVGASLVVSQEETKKTEKGRKLKDSEKSVLIAFLESRDPRGVTYKDLVESTEISMRTVKSVCNSFRSASLIYNTETSTGKTSTRMILTPIVRELIKTPEDIDKLEAKRGVFGELGVEKIAPEAD